MEAAKTVMRAAQNYMMVHGCIACITVSKQASQQASKNVAGCAASWLMRQTSNKSELATEPILEADIQACKE